MLPKDSALPSSAMFLYHLLILAIFATYSRNLGYILGNYDFNFEPKLQFQ